MTICIASMCLDFIVTVSDRRLSYSDVVEASDDATLKAFLLSDDWGLLFSGDDVGPVTQLVLDIRERLKPHKGGLTASIVQEQVRDAYRAAFSQRFVDKVLSRYGIKTVDEFRQNGLTEFGPEIFASVVKEINEFNLGIQLLVYGFDEGPTRWSNVFTVESPGVVTDHTLEGFGVIGSGSWPALAALTFQRATKLDSLNEAVYRACVAKFRSETASGVGKATTVMVFKRDGKMKQLPPGLIDKLREVWDDERKLPVPDRVEEILRNRFRPLLSEDDT